MLQIQTEVRFADILALMKANKVKFYLCHHVAYMIRDKLALIPGYEQRMKEIREDNVAWFRDETLEYEMASAPFYFIYEKHLPNSLEEQVVGQLNAWMVKLNPEIKECDLYRRSLHSWGLNQAIGVYENDLGTRGVRVALLEKILEIDPEAVLSVNL